MKQNVTLLINGVSITNNKYILFVTCSKFQN